MLSQYIFDWSMCPWQNLSESFTGKPSLSSSALKNNNYFGPIEPVAFWKSHSLQKLVLDYGVITGIYLGHVGSEKELCLFFRLIATLNQRQDYRAEKKVHRLFFDVVGVSGRWKGKVPQF